MPVHRRPFAIALLVTLAAAMGCERGCLATSRDPARGTEPSLPGAVDLSGTDCSDGLMRCIDGRIEASRAAHLPSTCGSGSPEGSRRNPERAGCVCPWEPFTTCRSGCAIDGFEVIGDRSDAGARQLCQPDAPVARAVLPTDPFTAEICTHAHRRCQDGIVRVCDASGQAARPLAYCLGGCQAHVGLPDPEDGPSMNPDGVVAILCRRDHAERR